MSQMRKLALSHFNNYPPSAAAPPSPAENHESPSVAYETITGGLASIYRTYVLKMEEDFRFDHFYSPVLTDGDFKAKPIVLLLGQYSTGKTTFIRHLLEKDYPGLRIGPEPTTDKFVAVCHPDDSVESGNSPAQVLQGNSAMVNKQLPWSQLASFGSGFINRFEVVHVKSHVFKGVTLVDTPGVLAGSKQWERGYDFEGVIKWFAERVDAVLIFFDAHKLDISDEFRRCILALRGNESKVSILLNKADSVNSQHLMRVYGALMWSLGKVMSAPEVPRIYIGSFWDQPLRRPRDEFGASPNTGTYGSEDQDTFNIAKLFGQETDDLFKLIYSLPARSASRKIDDFLKRAKKCYTHCILFDYMRRQLPQFIGKTSKQKELLEHLEDIYDLLSRKYQINIQDFPPPDLIRSKLQEPGMLAKFPKVDPKKLRDLDEKVKAKVAELTIKIPREELPMEVDCIVGSVETDANSTLWHKARSRVLLEVGQRPATAATEDSSTVREQDRPATADQPDPAPPAAAHLIPIVHESVELISDDPSQASESVGDEVRCPPSECRCPPPEILPVSKAPSESNFQDQPQLRSSTLVEEREESPPFADELLPIPGSASERTGEGYAELLRVPSSRIKLSGGVAAAIGSTPSSSLDGQSVLQAAAVGDLVHDVGVPPTSARGQ